MGEYGSGFGITKSGGTGSGGTITGSGTTDTIPIFTGATALGDSVITWNGESFTASLLSGFFRFEDATGYIQIFPNTSTISTNNDYLILQGSKGARLTDGSGTATWEAGALTLLENVGGGLFEIRSSSGDVEFTESGGGLQKIQFVGGVGAYTYSLPAATGTLALTSDITSLSLRNVTATDTFAAANETINCTANTFTVNLPTAVGIQGTTYTLVNSGTGTITLDPNGTETINGNTTIDLVQYVSRTVQSDGTNWIII